MDNLLQTRKPPERRFRRASRGETDGRTKLPNDNSEVKRD